jgi:Ala-tRNA(Pro) deacylase
MSIATTVGDALEFEAVDFTIVSQSSAAGPAQSAKNATISRESLAKAELFKDPHGYILTVVPASHTVDLKVLSSQLHRQLTPAVDDDLDELFCDCVVGSVPPLGPWYRVPTIVDSSLTDQSDIYFEAGDQDSLVHVSETGFERLLDGAEYLSFSCRE